MLLSTFLTVSVLATVLISIFLSIIFFGIGWLSSSLYFRKQMHENPPINETQIRELYRQTGRKLSERQVMQIMNSINRQGKR